MKLLPVGHPSCDNFAAGQLLLLHSKAGDAAGLEGFFHPKSSKTSHGSGSKMFNIAKTCKNREKQERIITIYTYLYIVTSKKSFINPQLQLFSPPRVPYAPRCKRRGLCPNSWDHEPFASFENF